MKYIIVLILSCFNMVFCYSQVIEKKILNQDKDTLIFWSKKRKLTWNDFKEVKKDTIFTDLAESYTEIKMIPYLFKPNVYSYKVFACFHKNKSFTNNTSDYLLNHEQLHFDITELFARKIRKEIQIQESKSSYVDYLSIYKKEHKAYRLYQNLYDAETFHSTNFEKQKKWEISIDNQLEELKGY